MRKSLRTPFSPEMREAEWVQVDMFEEKKKDNRFYFAFVVVLALLIFGGLWLAAKHAKAAELVRGTQYAFAHLPICDTYEQMQQVVKANEEYGYHAAMELFGMYRRTPNKKGESTRAFVGTPHNPVFMVVGDVRYTAEVETPSGLNTVHIASVADPATGTVYYAVIGHTIIKKPQIHA